MGGEHFPIMFWETLDGLGNTPVSTGL